jgi:tetratricopeptide (TPR) repeat protein
MTFELNRPTTISFPPDPNQLQDAIPSSKGVERFIAEASRYNDSGDFASAEQAYQNADILLGSERSPRHAEVLVCLALILRKRGEVAAAATYLDIALANFPEHRAALSQRLDLAREQGDLATAAALRTRMLRFCESAEARVHVLTEVVDDALEAAAAALRQAIELRPTDTELRERLRALLEATFDYEGAVNASVTLAESLDAPAARARVLASAANLCAKKVTNVDRAVALFEAAIADDPTVPGAFDAIEAVLVDAGDVVGTERAYSRQIERLNAGGHAHEQAALLHKLALLREEQLEDPTGAIEALEQATALHPDDVPSRLSLARVLERQGATASALRYLEGVAKTAPTAPVPYREVFRIALEANDFDRAFFAASVLVHLGEADEHEQSTYRRFATYGAPNATQCLDESNLTTLRPKEHPVRTLLLAIHDAAIKAKLSLPMPGNPLSLLDERERQEPEVSTVSAVKAVSYTLRLLGLPNFAIYVRPGQYFALSHPMSPTPALVLGSGMLSGRSIPELLFRTGYELGAQRELGRLPVFFPKAEELQTLVAAAVGLCEPAKLPSNALALANALDQHLDETARHRLRAMVEAVSQQHIDLDVSPMLRDFELVAGRLGLIACTDLTVAARQVAIESRATSGLTPAERVRDLLAFAISTPHVTVRSNLGMKVGSSKSIHC